MEQLREWSSISVPLYLVHSHARNTHTHTHSHTHTHTRREEGGQLHASKGGVGGVFPMRSEDERKLRQDNAEVGGHDGVVPFLSFLLFGGGEGGPTLLCEPDCHLL